jgi:hypothetical protein
MRPKPSSPYVKRRFRIGLTAHDPGARSLRDRPRPNPAVSSGLQRLTGHARRRGPLGPLTGLAKGKRLATAEGEGFEPSMDVNRP